MASYYLIANPTAGSGKARAAYDRVCSLLKERQIPFEAAETEYSGHASLLAKEAATAGYRRVIAFGGDGTLREVATGLIGTETEMAIIPCGTGNDLVRALQIPTDTDLALEIALHGTVREMNTATANGSVFINVGGFGFDVDVLDETERFKSRQRKGGNAYLMGLFSAIRKLRHRQTHITWVDENGVRHEADYNLLLFAACNGTHMGGGMNVGPGADPFDGLFHICIIHDINRLNMWNVLPKFLKGRHTGLRQTEYFLASEIAATCTPASRFQIDGEVKKGTPVIFNIAPEKLKVLVKDGQQA